ncbi:hypothetical protein SeMB42_g00176 [Synchytrium endobioticum]|uniref:Sm domain-containing protein n=1 Tax=Synchytrium endobioticum TaxID=286115 RepID=A0A507D886_9FUNG|nr:hypothetical protein SeLEV6574_g02609 [Synchytrium endobioticum]TPX54622.1 hypothetical protein SeMB42_g00176 [Synchytrium endobioticum]
MAEFINKHIIVSLVEGTTVSGTLYTMDAEYTDNLILVTDGDNGSQYGAVVVMKHAIKSIHVSDQRAMDLDAFDEKMKTVTKCRSRADFPM